MRCRSGLWIFGCVGFVFGLAVFPSAGDTAEGRQALAFDKAGTFGCGFSREGEEILCSTRTEACAKMPDPKAGAVWSLTFNQKVPQSIRFSAEGCAGELDDLSKYCLYADVTFSDGSHQWGVSKAFDTARAAGWHRREIVVRPKLPIRSVAFYLFIRGGLGEVRFRAPWYEKIVPDGLPRLDGVVTAPAAAPRARGFLLRDFAGGTWRPAKAFAEDVALEWREETVGEVSRIRATLRYAGRGDRAVTLLYAVPLGKEGALSWCAAPERTTALAPTSAEQTEVSSLACGAGITIWPFGAVACGDRGVAVGNDPFVPCPYRIGVSPALRLLYIAFDVALVAEHPVSEYAFTVFPFTASEGFRGALESFAALHPEAYRVRAAHQGNWMAFHSISNIPHFEDFGFRFKEGNSEMSFDDAHGIYTFYYTEPATWWMKLAKSGEGTVKVTREACARQVREMAARGSARAKAWLEAAVRDADGRPYGEIRDTPWCNGIVWSLNCAPGLRGKYTDFSLKLGAEALSARHGKEPAPFPKGLDGEYVDSACLGLAPSFDFDRRHFSGMHTPIAFTADAPHRPGIYRGMMAVEYVRGAAEAMHRIGRLAMANTTPTSSSMSAMWLDVMGTEYNWKRNGRWTPMSLAELYYRRAVCLAKPYCFLQNTDFTKFTHADVERYFACCTAFGMFPSFFSANAATGHYFSQPALYERDRALFRKYLPRVTELAEKGWRPVNRLVRVEDPAFVCEQFGEDSFTLYNASAAERKAVLRLDRAVSRVRELFSGAEAAVTGGCVRVTLESGACRAYRVQPVGIARFAQN